MAAHANNIMGGLLAFILAFAITWSTYGAASDLITQIPNTTAQMFMAFCQFIFYGLICLFLPWMIITSDDKEKL